MNESYMLHELKEGPLQICIFRNFIIESLFNNMYYINIYKYAYPIVQNTINPPPKPYMKDSNYNNKVPPPQEPNNFFFFFFFLK
ncbi:hypothetical protein PFNF54_01326 [Plasmodium falciparum NF54]|uniref:Uncharacterized protein n=1 Tax=Plasmodium falciparum (isolate NF54) TaxID=5843 RepID=W7KJP3_PLAFO|nr:hypothetical protein PFNF54_01326 [Plasmodium falciparum NF54]